MASGKNKKAVSASGSPSTAVSSAAHPAKQGAAKIKEERYRTLIEDVADGFYEADLRGNFKFFNDAFCRIFGYPREAILNRNYSDFMDEENARIAYDAFNRIFREGGSVADIAWEITRPDSERRFLEVSAKLIVDEAGRTLGFRGIARDITDLKRAEAALEESEELAEALARARWEGFEAGRKAQRQADQAKGRPA